MPLTGLLFPIGDTWNVSCADLYFACDFGYPYPSVAPTSFLASCALIGWPKA